ncbi:MAG: 23S rRNA (pseudouridine(1915)-N(3))-methyltransferase RlmH [Porphyromonadaceae bacterium]|nr:23S rRNA (pseudouridine(1915)-N(3))-methyltransferase RlmH [Porphyromonadaceae bacterium]
MKIKLILIGKTSDSRLLGLIDEYVSRLKYYISFEQIVIPELKNAKSMPVDLQKEKEADLILSKIAASDDLVLLDEHGKMLTSVGFSEYLSKKMNTSSRDLVFVVGGPYGFAPKIYEKAKFLLSFSTMTFSHQMIRLFFVEQLYRAMTILKGEPYHHA